MRSRLLIAAACLFAVAAGPAFAQSPTSRKPAPPDKVGGKTLEQWVEEMKRGDPSLRETATRAVPYFGESARAAVPTLLEVLQNDSDVACRVYACLALARVAEHVNDDKLALRAVKVLAAKADFDTQSIVRLFAVLALGSFGQRAAPAVPALINHIHDPSSWELRQAVVFALGSVAGDKKFGPDGRAVLALANVLTGDEKTGRVERSGRVRLAAVMALRTLGRPEGDKEFNAAKEALLQALKDHDKAVSVWALAGLIAIDGPTTEQRLSQLTMHLKGSDVMAKVSAASALGALGKEMAGSRIPEIIELLNDDDPLVLATAIDVLTGFGRGAAKAVPELRRIMEKKDQGDYFKQAASYAIEKISGEKVKPPAAAAAAPPKRPDPTEVGGKTLEQWIKDIKSPDPSLREMAIQAVPQFGKSAKAAVPALVGRLQRGERGDPDVACRVHAAIALAAIADHVPSSESAEVVKVLADRVDYDGQSIVRYHAVIALGAFGSQATPAIPSLVNRIHDPSSWEVRQVVVQVLANTASKEEKLGPDGRAVVAIANLLRGGSERSGEVRKSAVMALGVMGRPMLDRDFRPAVQALQESLNDHDKGVKIWAAVALMAVDKVTPQALDAVAKHLGPKEKDVLAKITAARALGAMGKEAKAKVLDITALLNEDDPVLISTALDVLATMGSSAHEAVPAINRFCDKLDGRNLKKDDKEYFKDAAKYAIEQIEGKAAKK